MYADGTRVNGEKAPSANGLNKNHGLHIMTVHDARVDHEASVILGSYVRPVPRDDHTIGDKKQHIRPTHSAHFRQRATA